MYNDAETIEVVNGLKVIKTYNLKKYYEENSDEIKNEIILFITELKNGKKKSENFKKLFVFDDYFSAWDLSLINEKNVYKSNCFYNLIKFIALKKIIKRKKKNNIILLNFEIGFIKIFKKCSEYLLHQKKIKILDVKKKNKSFKEIIIDTISYSSFLSLIYFIFYVFKNFNFYDNRKIKDKYNCIFLNYFTQYDQKELEKKKFKPNQWPKFLSNKSNVYWLNIFLPNKNFKSLNSINKYINKNKMENINFINNYLDYSSFFRIIKIYFKFNIKYFIFINFRNDYCLFLNKEIKRSLTCFHLLQNLSYHFSLKKIFEKNSLIKKKFFYLFENQPWERSFNFLLRKKKVNAVYGYSHTTINYWHLNYFHSLIENKNYKKNNLPEKILCHSQNCRNFLLDQGLPKKLIFNVSAERFKWTTKVRKKKISKKINILFLGDYEKTITKNFVKIINNLSQDIYFKNNYFLSYKPHPSTNYKEINFNKEVKIVDDNLKNIIHNYDVVVSTNSTAASAELSITNKKILIFLDKSNLDLSPFKKGNKYKYDFNFTDEIELSEKIRNIKDIKRLNYNFYFNKKLFAKWKKITR